MKEVEGIPKFLYHYTDIKSVKLILMNKTLRFTSLKYMDDQTEALTGDGTDLGKFIFASSWTELADNIPHWTMYGDSSKGVCLKMQSFPFKNNFNEYLAYGKISHDHNYDSEPSEIYITPPKYFFESDFVLMPVFTDDGLDVFKKRMTAKVKYTNDDYLLFPKIVNQDDSGLRIAFGKLGIYKSHEWEFQKEWRYKVIYTPFSVNKFMKDPNNNDISQKIIDDIFSTKHPIVEHIDYNLDEKVFDSVELIAGPMMEDYAYEELQYFSKGVNPNIVVNRSSLYGRWRNKNI